MRRWLLALALVPCACDSGPKTYGPVYDSGADATPDATPDAPGEASTDGSADAADAAPDAPGDAGSCSATLALLGGNATSLFGASGAPGSSLTAASLPGTLLDCGTTSGCANPIAIARFGSSLLAVLASSGGALDSTTFETSWADPAAIDSVSTIDGPSLAVVGQAAHLLYQDGSYKYFHAQYIGTSWDAASDPVGGGASQSFGARGPSGAAAGADLVAVQAGSDSYLYDQTWSGSWQAAHQQGGAAIQNSLPPVVLALSGGSSELLAAYLRVTDYKVMAVARTGGAWGTPMLVDANAYSNDPLAAVALPGGQAMLVFRGADHEPYFTVWDGATSWTAPAAVVSGQNPTVASTPAAAPGVCGADALVAWAESGGGVRYASFTGGAFGAPVPVGGTSGAKFVALGTLP